MGKTKSKFLQIEQKDTSKKLVRRRDIMKKIVLIMLVFALSLYFTTFALAASKTVPPASICMKDSFGYSYVLVIKLAGTVTMSGKPMNFYNINGAYYMGTASDALSGTGDVKGTEFHFSCAGSSEWNSEFWTVLVEAFWDLADTTNPVGTVTWRQITNTGTNIVESETLSLVNCSTLDLPY